MKHVIMVLMPDTKRPVKTLFHDDLAASQASPVFPGNLINLVVHSEGVVIPHGSQHLDAENGF